MSDPHSDSESEPSSDSDSVSRSRPDRAPSSRAPGEFGGSGNSGNSRNSEDDADDPPVASKLFVYVVPFVAALFLALGIAGTVAGGWAVVQPAIGGCDEPVIGVSSPEETQERLADDGGPVLERLAFEDLTPAEQRAFEEALENPQREGAVEGEFDHGEAFERGAVIEYEDTERYATLLSASRCLSVDPLALPLGIVSLLVGVGAFVLVAFRNYPREFIRQLEP